MPGSRGYGAAVPTPIRVALCDDDPVVLDALAAYLAADDGLRLVASWRSAVEVLAGLRPGQVDVLLLDVRMPGTDGPQLARLLAARPAPPRVLYLSSYPDDIPAGDPLDGTVAGALAKTITPADLARAVHLAHAGTSTVDASVQRRAAASVRPALPRWDLARDEREREVLGHLCRGFTNDQIAARTHRSTSSVKQILAQLCRRAGVHSRTELVLHLLGGPVAGDGDEQPGQ